MFLKFVPLLAVVTLLVVASVVGADDGPTPYPPVDDEQAWPGEGPVRDFEWVQPYRERFWSQRNDSTGAIVIVGDSLAEYWAEVGYDQAFGDQKVVNRGIGGDVTRGVLFRLQQDVLEIEPRAVVLLAGINDLTAHSKPKSVAKNLAAIVDQIEATLPGTPVLLCNLPEQSNPAAPFKSRSALWHTNAAIARVAAERENVLLVDLHEAMLDASGEQNLEYYRDDRLHLGPKGYQRANELLAKVARDAELVPAISDEAP